MYAHVRFVEKGLPRKWKPMTLPHLEEENRKHGRYDLRQSEWASTVQNQIHPGLRGWPTGPYSKPPPLETFS